MVRSLADRTFQLRRSLVSERERVSDRRSGAEDLRDVQPDELEGLDEDAIKLKYQEGVERNQASKEDMSDLIALEARKRKRKQDQASQRAAKKSKDFKF